MTAPMNLKKREKIQELCPIVGTIKAIVTESRLLIVRQLFFGPKRFNELLRASGVNSKTLSLTLKFLEEQGIVRREVLSTRPFTVQYSLTPSGLDLKPTLAELGNWGNKWLPEFRKNKAKSGYSVITQNIPNRRQILD
jgi:DNA-binding HxlR family transcriptional regulator